MFQPESRSLTGFPGGHADGYLDTLVQVFKQVYKAKKTGKVSESGQFATFEDGQHEMVLCQAIQNSAQENKNGLKLNINESTVIRICKGA